MAGTGTHSWKKSRRGLQGAIGNEASKGARSQKTGGQRAALKVAKGEGKRGKKTTQENPEGKSSP